MGLREQINDDVKNAMRAKDSARLGTLRLLTAEIKRKEVDERIEVQDADILNILGKMIKQRKDSIAQFEAGGRQDLADVERAEVEVLATYQPAALSDAEVDQLIAAAISESGASGPADMGKVVGLVKAKAGGRADMGAVSARIKAALAK